VLRLRYFECRAHIVEHYVKAPPNQNVEASKQSPTENEQAELKSLLSELEALAKTLEAPAKTLGFQSLVSHVGRVQTKFEIPAGITWGRLSNQLVGLRESAIDNIDSISLVVVPDREYYQVDSLFGSDVATKFSDVTCEIKEAVSCLALG